MYKRILVAIDGSNYAVRAAEHAIELAKRFQAEVDLINVVDFEETRAEIMQERREDVEETRRATYQPVVDMLTEENIQHEVFVFYGNPANTIIDHANDQKYDLLLIGSRGLNMLQEMVLGSVSHKVVKRAECPVLLVK